MPLPFKLRQAFWYKRHPQATRGRSWKFMKGVAYKDFDGDGKVNRYDCRPLNPFRQDNAKINEVFRPQRQNRLPVQVAIIVPSTNKDKHLPPKQFQKRVRNERKWMGDTFGGTTSVQSVGSYNMNGQVITEKGVLVQSSMSVDAYNKHKKALQRHIVGRRREWKQDTLGYQVEGNMYIYPKKAYIDDDKNATTIEVQ